MRGAATCGRRGAKMLHAPVGGPACSIVSGDGRRPTLGGVCAETRADLREARECSPVPAWPWLAGQRMTLDTYQAIPRHGSLGTNSDALPRPIADSAIRPWSQEGENEHAANRQAVAPRRR
jgi:hypothetical protein